jgi:hypothetical protein
MRIASLPRRELILSKTLLTSSSSLRKYLDLREKIRRIQRIRCLQQGRKTQAGGRRQRGRSRGLRHHITAHRLSANLPTRKPDNILKSQWHSKNSLSRTPIINLCSRARGNSPSLTSL